jgi:hypothetical protein
MKARKRIILKTEPGLYPGGKIKFWLSPIGFALPVLVRIVHISIQHMHH